MHPEEVYVGYRSPFMDEEKLVPIYRGIDRLQGGGSGDGGERSYVGCHPLHWLRQQNWTCIMGIFSSLCFMAAYYYFVITAARFDEATRAHRSLLYGSMASVCAICYLLCIAAPAKEFLAANCMNQTRRLWWLGAMLLVAGLVLALPTIMAYHTVPTDT